MASITINVTHPQLTRSKTITLSDARLLEFADVLRTHVYGTPAAPVTRVQAVDTLLLDMSAQARGLWARAKSAEAAAIASPPPEIDA